MKRGPSDPAFTLPTQTLLKLKPARDVFYMRRSIPDLAQFRTAFQLLKAWARDRGVYSAKFGYLGGIHISVLLVRVCKMLLHDGGVISVPDLIVTFFSHYSTFDWKEDMAFDPFFHKKLRYNRTFREPMCLLGWHTPSLNTAANASVPTVKTIAAELKRADNILSGEDCTWETFLGIGDEAGLPSTRTECGASEFLKSYKSYARLGVHYWGPSLEKGSQFVGWLESRCVALLVGV
jgi:poly(A) polymerase Pap1